jgi:hypothetical protein
VPCCSLRSGDTASCRCWTLDDTTADKGDFDISHFSKPFDADEVNIDSSGRIKLAEKAWQIEPQNF